MKSTLITLGVIFLFLCSISIWIIGISNSEKRIKLRGEAQQESCEAYFSNMWELLQTQAGVTDQYKEAFMEIYPKLIEGRYSKGDGSLMKWITESNPTFDTKLYDKLMVSIEAQRKSFFMEQKELIDIDREHKTLCQIFPNSLIIGNREPIGGEKGIIILKNLATKEAYESGTDASPDLFNNKDKE
ncbi:hypothetical protein M0Q50_06585 [bacterium]|jgi:hypothetical protein|nr:hypothetical protein [bacterium]